MGESKGPKVAFCVPTQVAHQAGQRVIDLSDYGDEERFSSRSRRSKTNGRPRVTYKRFMACVFKQWGITAAPESIALSCTQSSASSTPRPATILVSSEIEWMYVWKQHRKPSSRHSSKDLGPVFTIVPRPSLPSWLKKPYVDDSESTSRMGTSERKSSNGSFASKNSTATNLSQATKAETPSAAHPAVSSADVGSLKDTLEELVTEASEMRKVLRDSLQVTKDCLQESRKDSHRADLSPAEQTAQTLLSVVIDRLLINPGGRDSAQVPQPGGHGAESAMDKASAPHPLGADAGSGFAVDGGSEQRSDRTRVSTAAIQHNDRRSAASSTASDGGGSGGSGRPDLLCGSPVSEDSEDWRQLAGQADSAARSAALSTKGKGKDKART